MIPITLKIKGLYSYVEEQIIDFKRLTEAGLFGIFGEVGSGKSTILEAIALSLYAKSERLNVSGDDRYYNMLNLKINEAIIEFQFSAGVQNHVFQSTLRLVRNKKNFDEVNLKSHTFHRIVNGATPEPVDPEIVLEAVGISYENFKRTIIIPQGQFKEFLDLSSTERTRMLKELFGLQRFELSPKLALIDGENKAALQRIEGELKAYVDINTESIELIQAEWQQRKGEAERLQKEKNALEITVLDLQKLKKNIEELTNKKENLPQKLSQESIDLKQEKDLAEYEALMGIFQQPYLDLRKYKDAIEEAEKQIEEGIKINADIEKELTEVNKNLHAITNKANQAESFRNKSLELDKVIVINTAREELNAIEKKILKAQKLSDDLKAAINQKKEERNNLVEKKTALGKKIIPETILFATKNWFREITQQANEIELQIQELAAINQQIQDIDVQLGSYHLDNFSNQAEFELIYLKHKQLTESEKENATNAFNTIHIQKELQQHAALLVDGQPCTLCGAVHHPNPVSMKDFTSDIEQLILQIEKSNAQLEKLSDIRVAVTGLLENKIRLNHNWKSVSDKLELLKSKHATTKLAQPNKTYGIGDIDLFTANENISIEAKIDLDKIEKLIQDAFSFIELETETLKELDIALANLQLKQGILQTTIANNAVGLKEITAEAYANKTAQAIAIEKNQLLEDIESNEAALVTTQQIATELEKQQTLLVGKMQGIKETIKNNEDLQAQTREQIKLLVAKGDLNETEIIAIIRTKLDAPALRAAISENRKALHLLQGEITTLENLIAGASFNETIFIEKTALLNQTNEQLTKATESKGNLEGQLKSQQAALDKKTVLQIQQQAFTIRAADIATLKKLFNASGFVEFVSKRYLQNVVALANERFKKMVRQKFGMELSEKGDFMVRDYLNGGKTRLLKSLSGGQTFQAALCLALALSESIQRNAGIDQHFFFLDEGFGSLDKENLQIVLATLQSLRHENRVVGLISHVEELQQEMDVFLKVDNDPVRGTMIKESWKN
jgi:exonuclease SbcC